MDAGRERQATNSRESRMMAAPSTMVSSLMTVSRAGRPVVPQWVAGVPSGDEQVTSGHWQDARVTQPSPSYQPYQPLPPVMGIARPPKSSGGGLTSLLAGILAVVAAGLAFGGSFAAITTFRNTFQGGGETTVTANNVSWWSLTDAGS